MRREGTPASMQAGLRRNDGGAIDPVRQTFICIALFIILAFLFVYTGRRRNDGGGWIPARSGPA